MKSSLLAALAIVLVLGLTDRWFVALDECAYSVGSMISDLKQNPQPVDQTVVISSLYVILETKCDIPDPNLAIFLTGTILLIGLVWLKNGRSGPTTTEQEETVRNRRI